MKFTPIGDRILVSRLEETDEKRGGIYIPDAAKEKPQQGKVMAVGKGKPTMMAKYSPWMSKQGIIFSSGSIREQKSNWTVRSS